MTLKLKLISIEMRSFNACKLLIEIYIFLLIFLPLILSKNFLWNLPRREVATFIMAVKITCNERILIHYHLSCIHYYVYGIITVSLCVVVMVTVCSCHGIIARLLSAYFSRVRYNVIVVQYRSVKLTTGERER